MPEQITREQVKRAIEDEQTILRTDVEIEPVDGDSEIKPPMTDLLDLSEKQQERLKKEVFDLFEHLKDERKEYDSQVTSLEAQYGGEIIPEKHMEFSLNVPVTQVKCDAVERLAIKAFLESDPMFSCSLRPEAIRKGMDAESIRNIERDQEDYLDYVLDERVNIASPLRKTIHQSVILKGGFMKIPYCYKKKRTIREEFYSGKKVDSGKVDESGNPIYIAEGMNEFLSNYPKATMPFEMGHKYFLELTEFKDVRFRSKYWKTVFDDPKPLFVNTKNFWARKSAEGYDGLCDEQIYFERTGIDERAEPDLSPAAERELCRYAAEKFETKKWQCFGCCRSS